MLDERAKSIRERTVQEWAYSIQYALVPDQKEFTESSIVASAGLAILAKIKADL